MIRFHSCFTSVLFRSKRKILHHATMLMTRRKHVKFAHMKMADNTQGVFFFCKTQWVFKSSIKNFYLLLFIETWGTQYKFSQIKRISNENWELIILPLFVSPYSNPQEKSSLCKCFPRISSPKLKTPSTKTCSVLGSASKCSTSIVSSTRL